MTTALRTLLEQAERDRDAAQLALRRAEDAAGRADAQRRQLEGYRSEYLQRWSGQFARRGAIEIVHCYQSFGTRLDEAVAQQAQQSHAAAAQVERALVALRAAEMRVASVRKLIERRDAEQRRAQDRREQRLSDEHAQQAHRRATTAH